MNGSESIGVIGLLKELVPLGYTVLGAVFGLALALFWDTRRQRLRRKNYLLPTVKFIDGKMVEHEDTYERTVALRDTAMDNLEQVMNQYSTASTPHNLRLLVEGLTHFTDVGHLHAEAVMNRASTNQYYQLLIGELELAGASQEEIDSSNLQYPDRNATSEATAG